jgi:pimeloyl-ACP methyl ester carboxylesterase
MRSLLRSLLVPGPRALETYRVAISRISVPALVFSGDRDGCIADEVYSGIEGAFTRPVGFEIVRGAGHFLPLEATDRVADLAIPFARS